MTQLCRDARRRTARRLFGAAAVAAFGWAVVAAPAVASPGTQVLVYTGNGGITEATFNNFAASAGRNLVSRSVLPADLSANSCVLLPSNTVRLDTPPDVDQIATLRAYMLGGGTIVAMGENGIFPSGPYGNVTMSELAAALGVSITAEAREAYDNGPHVISGPTRIAASPYTVDVNSIGYAYTTRLEVLPPASVLLSTDFLNFPFLAVQDFPGGGKFVMSGDTNVFSDELGAYTSHDNGFLARNLCGDIVDPKVTLVTPSEGARYKKNQVVNANWFCTDDDSGIDPNPLKTFGTVPDGQPIDTSVPSGTSVTKKFRATCTDKAGNSVFEEHSYVVDDRPPTIAIDVPGAGPYVLNSIVKASWSCTDPDNDVAAQSFTNGALSGSVSGLPIVTSPEGPKSFTVSTCTDLLGNSASPQTVQYTVANSPPVPAITSPTNDARFKVGTPVNAVWACTDPDGPGDLVTQNSLPAVVSGAPADTVTPGPHTFEVTCADEDGPVTKSVSYFVDGSPPVAAIAVPIDGGVYERRTTVLASWVCTDDDGLADIDTNPLKTFGTTPVGQAIDTASVGAKTFAVTCTDLVGNSSGPKTVRYTVIDASPPVVTIAVPKDGATYSQDQVVAPSYACTDPDGITDIRSCAREGGATGPVDTSKGGTFAFTVNGEDQAGNKGTATVHYKVTPKAGTSPATTVSPSTAKSVKACTSRRQFRIRVKKLRGGVHAVAATVFVNGKKTLTRKGKRVTALVTLKGLKKGQYKVKINVRYSNGRVLSYTRKFKTCTPKGK